jgi:hypothetical protein
LWNRVRAARDVNTRAADPDALSESERDELRRLRRDNVELRTDKEILRRAVLNSTGQRNTVFTVEKQTGGYVPPPRKRRDGHLSLAEREEISRGLAKGDSIRAIARRIHRGVLQPATTSNRPRPPQSRFAGLCAGPRLP